MNTELPLSTCCLNAKHPFIEQWNIPTGTSHFSWYKTFIVLDVVGARKTNPVLQNGPVKMLPDCDIQHTQCQSSENRCEEQRLICDLTDRKPHPLPFWLLSFQLGQQLCLQWGQQLLHHQVSQHLQRDRGSHYWSQWYQTESRHKTPTWHRLIKKEQKYWITELL